MGAAGDVGLVSRQRELWETDLVTRFLEARAESPRNTLVTYERVLRSFAGWLNGPPERADAAAVSRFIASERSRGQKPGSIAVSISTLRSFFEFVCGLGLCGENPARAVKRPSVRQRKRVPCLSPVEVKALLEAFDDKSALGLRDRCMIELMYSGARASELDAIDVKCARRALKQHDPRLEFQGAQGRERVVVLNARGRDALERYLNKGRPDLARGKVSALLLSRVGAPIDRRDVWRVLRRGLERANLPPSSPSVLQRSFALHMIELGEPVECVQSALGHAWSHTTERFLGEHFRRFVRTEQRQREAADLTDPPHDERAVTLDAASQPCGPEPSSSSVEGATATTASVETCKGPTRTDQGDVQAREPMLVPRGQAPRAAVTRRENGAAPRPPVPQSAIADVVRRAREECERHERERQVEIEIAKPSAADTPVSGKPTPLGRGKYLESVAREAERRGEVAEGYRVEPIHDTMKPAERRASLLRRREHHIDSCVPCWLAHAEGKALACRRGLKIQRQLETLEA